MAVYSARLQNGPLEVGPLADRGAFDQYASYRPGQIVVDGGVVYLNIAPVGVDPELEDTFDRRDQSGWGSSSHGEVWQTSDGWANGGPPAIVGNHGLMSMLSGPAGTDGQLLGPSRTRGDAEVLAHLDLPAPGTDTLILSLLLNATEDGTYFAEVNVGLPADGETTLQVNCAESGHLSDNGDSAAGPTLSAAQACWLRLRRVGLVYSATLWPVGTAEPATPQATHTAAAVQPAGHPCVFVGAGDVGASVLLSYFAVRPLTAAAAPSGDTDHWVALADALQVPQPL